MTGLRGSPMRRRVCISCQTKFVPKRLDAVTCSDRCRMAEYRKRDARAKAEALFKTRQQIAQNTSDQEWALECNQYAAAAQNDHAEDLRVKYIRFAGVQSGVLAVQAVCEIDLPWPVPWRPRSWWKGWKELKHDPNSPEAGDPEVIQAVVEVLKRDVLGWPYRRREHESECQALLRGAVKRISLFVETPDWKPPGGWTKLPTWSDWDDGVNWDRAYNSDQGSLDVEDLMGGGGYQVFDSSKGHP